MEKEKFVFEFWAVDKDGNKYHEHYHTKSSRVAKVKAQIEEKYLFKIDTCLDFGMRRVFNN